MRICKKMSPVMAATRKDVSLSQLWKCRRQLLMNEAASTARCRGLHLQLHQTPGRLRGLCGTLLASKHVKPIGLVSKHVSLHNGSRESVIANGHRCVTCKSHTALE